MQANSVNQQRVGRFIHSIIILVLMLNVFAGPVRQVSALPSTLPLLQTFDCTAVTQIPEEECAALVALYNSTDGANWADNTNWLLTTSPCNWYGVQCETGNISKLFLGNNQLSGTIPLEIASLALIKELYLDNNPEIIGVFPSGIRNLVNLEVLRLHHTQTSGTIPTWIGELTYLQRLHLENNQLTGSIPVELTTLTNLKTLNISFNQLTGFIPAQFSNLTSLQQAYLGRNQFSGGFPTQFSLLPGLEILHLYDSGLSGTLPAEIGDFPSITSLDLSNNAFSGPVPAEIGNLQSLQQLWLRNNDLTGEVPFSITNLMNLDLLDLSCNQLVSTNPAVQAFLDTESPGWQEAQCFPEASIVARLTLDQVDTSGWPAGTLLNLTIDDPLTELSPDYSDFGVSQPNDPDAGTSFNFFFGDDYTLNSGDEVTVEGGGITRMHTVADIHVTNVDVQGDKIYGTAGDGITSVNVRLWSSPIEMQRDADVIDGNWVADFSVSTPDYEEYNIKPGDNGVVRWFEGDGDFTTDYWEVPNPTFAAFVNAEFIEGYQWPLDATVILEVDDPSTGANPDYTDSTIVAAADWDPSQTWFNFQLEAYDLKTDDIVTLSTDGIEKQLAVVDLTITTVNFLADVVHGTADPNQPVSISVCGDDFCIFRDETADSSGIWSANFAEPAPGNGPEDTIDIRAGIWINAFIWDEDGDNTSVGFTAETPQCQPGNSISGTVFEHDGTTPIHNASIQIEDFNTGEILFTALTDQSGQFGCTLPNGDYRAMATGGNYSREYFDQAHATNAAQLTITTGTQLTDINFTLSHLATMEHLTFNLDNPLLQELSVRQAIFLGINRQEILNEAFLPNGNFGLISNSIVPSEHWASAPASELTLYPYDPTEAEAILDAAGWINRDADIFRENISGTELAFTFKTTQAQLRIEAAELFRQYMEAIGIRITVETIPASEFFGDTGTVATGDFDIAEFAWGDGYDDETFAEPYITGHIANHSGYSSPAFDAAMANAAAASTESEKLTYYYEAQSILSQDLPIVPYFTRYDVAPVATDPGTDITVSPEAYLDITFDEVTDGGATTVLITNIDPADLPPNFQVLGEVYDIGTSASFTSAQVCFSYDDAGLTLAQEESVRLLHLENGSWMNVTDAGYPDTTNNEVCGTVTSFSPFAIAYSDDSTPPTITWIGDIEDGDTFYFGFVPPSPTCTAEDASGVDGGCVVTGHATFVGEHTLTATASDNAGNTAIETRDYIVLEWTVQGFYQPVDMNDVYNLVKNGSTVPLKFEIFAGSTELTDPALIQSLTYAQTSCDSVAITDEIEATVLGGTSLRYDSTTGQFIYNWKTPRVAGNCYRLTLTTVDGSTLVAYFKLK